MSQAENASVCAPRPRSRRCADAFVDHLEDGITYHHVLIAFARGAGQLELPSIELFVDHDRTRPVPSQNLHGVAAFSNKYKQRARKGLSLHLLPNEPAKALVAEPHVNRSKCHIHG